MFVGFLLVFVIGAPCLILHTAGYRVDWSQKRLFKTSLISVNTEPEGATVILNGVTQKNKTPLFLSDLLPGTYTIQLSKDGFLPWQDSIALQSKQAAVLGTIDLIVNQTPQLLINRPVTQIMTTPDHTAAFVFSQADGQLVLERLTLPDNSVQNLGTYASDSALLSAPLDNRILITNPTDLRAKYFLIDAKSPTNPLPLDFISADLRQWQWISNNELLALSTDGLCNVLIAEQKVNCQTFTGQYFWYANNAVYYITNQDQTSYLYLAKDLDIGRAELVARLPRSDKYRLISENSKTPALIDDATQDLFTMDLKNSLTNLVRIPAAAKNATWNRDHSQLLYYNNYEVMVWNVAKNEHNLLTRVSQPISSVAWCGDFPHIIMSYAGQLIMLDNQTNPASSISIGDKIDDWLEVDSDGHWAIYLSNSQSRSTLWLKQLHV
jgi:hypothetical protein